MRFRSATSAGTDAVDHDGRRPVDAEIHLLFVFVLTTERIAAAGGQEDRQSQHARGRLGRPPAHRANDILRFPELDRTIGRVSTLHDVPRLFLIDGSSQMYRAYHAIHGLTGPDGRSTNAVYGFSTMLRKLLADHAPEFIAASFDLAGPTFREDLSADYKANRAPMPSDLAEQVPLVREACEALGVPILTFERYEADDVIGTLAIQAKALGFDVAIVTGDKDFFQLVDDRVARLQPAR